jgi:hypothetical protein
MAAGAREPVVSLVDRTLAGAPVGNGASLIPGGERRRVADAALAPRLTIDNVDIEIVVAESGKRPMRFLCARFEIRPLDEFVESRDGRRMA